MRLFNNTKFEDEFLINFIKPHYFYAKAKAQSIPGQYVESIEIREHDDRLFKITIFGEDCILWEGLSNEDHEVDATVQWFNESSGEGVARVGELSFAVFACNIVGADSYYPQLVKNKSLKEGQKIKATLSSDIHIIENCGLTNIKEAS